MLQGRYRVRLTSRVQGCEPLLVGEGAGLTLAGLVVGGLAALALARVLQSLLYEVESRDPGTYAAVTLTLGGVAFAACFVPAWRASREDAVVALRAEEG